jgi:hypothetical protein
MFARIELTPTAPWTRWDSATSPTEGRFSAARDMRGKRHCAVKSSAARASGSATKRRRSSSSRACDRCDMAGLCRTFSSSTVVSAGVGWLAVRGASRDRPWVATISCSVRCRRGFTGPSLPSISRRLSGRAHRLATWPAGIESAACRSVSLPLRTSVPRRWAERNRPGRQAALSVMPRPDLMASG